MKRSNRLELSFDAWGNRRDPNTWQNLNSALAGLITDRGFTGHLHLDGFKLINMNGRIYDQVLGRFLSPDNFVQDAGSTQDYNRYSYCGNNPLIYTDPSGWMMAMTMKDAETYLLSNACPNGGTWESGGGGSDMGNVTSFDSNDQAQDAGTEYENKFDSWGYTVYGREYNKIAAGHQILSVSICSRQTCGGYRSNLKGSSLVVTIEDKGSSKTYVLDAYLYEIPSGQGGSEHFDGWYNPTSKVDYSIGIIAEGMSDLGHSGRLIKTGEVGGKVIIGLGIVSDGIGIYNYYKKGPDNPNSVSPGKAILNTTFGVYGFWNPAVPIVYGGIDLCYPKGLEGYFNDLNKALNPNKDLHQEQLILQNSMSPF